MATLSKGTKLGYAEYTESLGVRVPPVSYTYIPDITSIPSLSGPPTSHDVTRLTDEEHVYIMGLQDNGGSFEFSCLFTNDLIDEIDAVIALQDAGDVIEWAVEFPSPVSQRVFFNGQASVVYNENVEVDAPLTATLVIVPNTIIDMEAIT